MLTVTVMVLVMVETVSIIYRDGDHCVEVSNDNSEIDGDCYYHVDCMVVFAITMWSI